MPTKPKKLTYNPLDMLVSGDSAAPAGPVVEIDPAAILPHPQQPRTYYDAAAQAELEASVRASGIHQPLIVRPQPGGRYQLVAGSRRLAAAQAAGLSVVPVVVREYSDAEAEQVALVENIQRANLRFDDEAQALLRLKHQFAMTNEAVGRAIGKSTDYVELRIAAAEYPAVIDLYLAGAIEQKQIRAAIRALKEGRPLPSTSPELRGDPSGSDAEAEGAADPNGSDDGRAVADPNPGVARRNTRGPRPGRRPPDGWRWAGDVERRLQQLPARAPRMDQAERARAREYLLRLREATDHVLCLLDE